MRRAAVVAALAAASLVRCPAFAQTPRALKVAGVPEESIVTALWAEQSGLFRRNGIDLQIEPQRSGSAIAAGVAGGAYSIGKSSLVALIVAHAHAVPFVLIAPGGVYDSAHSNNALLVKAGSPIRTAADLSGKTVGVSSLNDLFTISIKLWVDQNGGDSTALKLVELPIDAVGSALALGRIDATSVGTPQLQEFLDSGTVRIAARPFDAIAAQFMFSAWFTTRDFLAANRPVVEGFVHAMRDAAAYVNAHQPQTVDVLAKFTSISPAIIARMPRATMGTALEPRLVQPVIDASAKEKAIAAPFGAAEFIATGLV